MIYRSQRVICRSLVMFVVLGLAGCSGRPSTIYIEGTIRHEGQPVENATVVFMPEGGQGHPASGVTDVEGVFVLTTFEQGDGAIRGEYRVVIMKNEGRPGPPPPIEAGDEKSITEHYKAIMINKKRKPLLPLVYSTYERTPLRWTVSSTDKKVDFDLTGK
jgi:hypothetical protein